MAMSMIATESPALSKETNTESGLYGRSDSNLRGVFWPGPGVPLMVTRTALTPLCIRRIFVALMCSVVARVRGRARPQA
jgi:hypothetical protein